MTLFRSPRRRPSRLERLLRAGDLQDAMGRAEAVTRQRAGGEMPPRPQRHDPGPVTAPRLFAPRGPVDPASDPCGAPPLGDGEGAGS